MAPRHPISLRTRLQIARDLLRHDGPGPCGLLTRLHSIVLLYEIPHISRAEEQRLLAQRLSPWVAEERERLRRLLRDDPDAFAKLHLNATDRSYKHVRSPSQ